MEICTRGRAPEASAAKHQTLKRTRASNQLRHVSCFHFSQCLCMDKNWLTSLSVRTTKQQLQASPFTSSQMKRAKFSTQREAATLGLTLYFPRALQLRPWSNSSKLRRDLQLTMYKPVWTRYWQGRQICSPSHISSDWAKLHSNRPL